MRIMLHSIVLVACTLPSLSQSRTKEEQQAIRYGYQSVYGVDPTSIDQRYKSNSPYAQPYDGTFSSNIKYIYNKTPKPTPLNSYQMRKAVFKIADTQTLYPNNITDLSLCKKMGLVTDVEPNTKNEGNLLFYLSHAHNKQNKQIKVTQTAGAIPFLLNTLTQPHTDITEIKRKQAIIRELANNTALFSNVTNALKTVGKHEHYFLSYFNKINPDFAVMDRVTATLKHSALPIPIIKQLMEPVVNRLNNNAQALNLSALKFYFSQIFTLPITISAGPGALESMIKTAYNYYPKTVRSNAIKGWNTIAAQQFNTTKETLYKKASNTLYVYYAINTIPNYLSSYKYDFYVINHAQKHLIGVAKYIQNIKNIYAFLRDNSPIASHLPALTEFEALVTPSSKHSKEFNQLLQLLSTRTFTGKPSLLSNIGRILRAHTLMSTESVQKEFAGIVNAIGELDTYCALAQKIKLTADKDAHYSFIEFDTDSTTPYIQAIGLWNPFIPESKAVTNNIVMGNSRPRNIIMNGPNTGGKSTLGKGVLLNIILAQTFGIAAAKHMKLTPFGNLDCFMNMTDDTANGISGLKAEVKRAKEIINRIEHGKSSDFHFMLLDEIFTATSPDQAGELAHDFLESLADMPNVLFINATHFEDVIQLGQQSSNCRNCHMGAITDVQNKNRIIKYTHKLVEGRSHIKNAAQVAEDSGLTFKRKRPHSTNTQPFFKINAPAA